MKIRTALSKEKLVQQLAEERKIVSDEQYGELSAEYYQWTKPPGAKYLDFPYYKKKLKAVSGKVLEVRKNGT